MQRQHEITKVTELLNPDGSLREPGYCKRNLFVYNKQNIAASKWRVKEWNFHQISNGRMMVQLNFFNISIASAVTASITNLKTGESASDMAIELFTPNENALDSNAEEISRFTYERGGRRVLFDTGLYSKRMLYSGKSGGGRFEIDLTCERQQGRESLTIATPFKQPGRFFLTQKICCMPTFGTVTLGEREYKFSSDDSYTVLDWGRGVWPHSNMWYWASGSTRLADGRLFGFELTWGFGEEDNATETAIFCSGRCHKIGRVRLEADPEESGWMKPWHFISDDGRFDMVMTPFYDNYNNMMPLGLVGMKTHQVHGFWSGRAVLDDQTTVQVQDMYAFCEKVYNKW